MQRSDVAKGIAVVLGVIIAGSVSTAIVDRHFATAKVASSSAPAACVGKDGSWKNWRFPNVPTLSPKCRSER
jgi:hypothetical protein